MLLQVQDTPAWVGPTMAISLAIIAFAFAIIGFVVAVLGLAVSRQLKDLRGQMAGVQDDLQRTMKSVRKGAKDIRGVTALVHEQVAAFASTGEELRGKVLDAADHVQERLQDIEALYDVVYEEVADTALDVAAGVRTFKRNPILRTVRRFLSR
jgi:uncharacterized protein YoxC